MTAGLDPREPLLDRLQPLVERRARPVEALDPLLEPVEAVLDPLQSLGYAAQRGGSAAPGRWPTGRFSAPIAASWARTARSRVSNAADSAPLTTGFSSSSWASLPIASSLWRVTRSRKPCLRSSSGRLLDGLAAHHADSRYDPRPTFRSCSPSQCQVENRGCQPGSAARYSSRTGGRCGGRALATGDFTIRCPRIRLARSKTRICRGRFRVANRRPQSVACPVRRRIRAASLTCVRGAREELGQSVEEPKASGGLAMRRCAGHARRRRDSIASAGTCTVTVTFVSGRTITLNVPPGERRPVTSRSRAGRQRDGDVSHAVCLSSSTTTTTTPTVRLLDGDDAPPRRRPRTRARTRPRRPPRASPVVPAPAAITRRRPRARPPRPPGRRRAARSHPPPPGRPRRRDRRPPPHRRRRPSRRRSRSRSRHRHPVAQRRRPAPSNPTFSFSLPGAAPIGVPNFFIDTFQIPPFLLPIYQAAGIEYDVPWQVLAAINEIETDYGRNLCVSSAGAVGWMQFLPRPGRNGASTPTARATPTRTTRSTRSSPPPAISTPPAPRRTSRRRSSPTTTPTGTCSRCCSARKLIGGMPSPADRRADRPRRGPFPGRRAGQVRRRRRRPARQAARQAGSNAAIPVDSDPARRAPSIFAKQGSPVIAVNDGKIVKVGHNAAAGPLHRAPGLDRQRLHVRAARLDPEAVPGAQAGAS